MEPLRPWAIKFGGSSKSLRLSASKWWIVSTEHDSSKSCWNDHCLTARDWLSKWANLRLKQYKLGWASNQRTLEVCIRLVVAQTILTHRCRLEATTRALRVSQKLPLNQYPERVFALEQAWSRPWQPGFWHDWSTTAQPYHYWIQAV